MELKEKLVALATSNLSSPAHFLVDVVIKGHDHNRKVIVLLDGDRGVSIEDCVALSRRLGAELEEQDLIKGRYTLEVSSAGLDHPLLLPRQYQARVGRTLRIRLADDSELEGELLAADDKEIKIAKIIVNKKQKTTKEELTLPYEEIKRAMVQVSFK